MDIKTEIENQFAVCPFCGANATIGTRRQYNCGSLWHPNGKFIKSTGCITTNKFINILVALEEKQK